MIFTKVKLLIIGVVVLTFLSNNLSAQPLQLTAQESLFQFPFFDNKTPVWAYNGQIPGPTIFGTKGETITIQFFNQLKEPSSIHWHGLRIENAMDGVPGVTQEPVGPGEKFIYRLFLSESGTFWYHPHFNASEQLERGLKGVFIVEEKEKLPWSQDLIWLLDDWLLLKEGTIYPKFNTGRDLMHDGRWGNAPTINGKFRPEYIAAPGERIRIRLINGANGRIFSPNFKGLSATVIAVDGKPVSNTFSLSRFPLAPGNRIDIDLTIPSQNTADVYTIEDTFSRKAFPLAYIKIDKSKVRETPEFKVATNESFIPASMFESVTTTKIWDLNAIRGGKFGIGWAMNLKLWPNPDTAEFQVGSPQKVIFKNSSSRLHPMHIHGVFFRVLERNGVSDVEPFTRDTVLLGPRETVTIGFVPMHSGVWLTHCHIQEHAEAGMMTTIAVDDNNQ